MDKNNTLNADEVQPSKTNQSMSDRKRPTERLIDHLLGFDEEGCKEDDEYIPDDKFEPYELGCFHVRLTLDELDKLDYDNNEDEREK